MTRDRTRPGLVPRRPATDGSVKRHDAALAHQKRQQRRQVAVADEGARPRRPAGPGRGAAAAATLPYPPRTPISACHVGPAPGVVERVRRAAPRRPRRSHAARIRGHPRPGRSRVSGARAMPASNSLDVERAGGRHDGDPRPGRKRREACAGRRSCELRHLRRDRLMTLAAHDLPEPGASRAAVARSRRRPSAPSRNRSLAAR